MSDFFIDRRENPKDKSLGSRQRFLKRARSQLKAFVNKSAQNRSIGDIGKGGDVSIPTDGLDEPNFRHSREGGIRHRIFNGNRKFRRDDKLPKPDGGVGSGGRQASDSGEGEDEFRFTLTREEFLDLFFEDLELPDLVKVDLKEITTKRPHRVGFSSVGIPTNIDLLRTMENRIGRCIALRRPKKEEVQELEDELTELSSRIDELREYRDGLAEFDLQGLALPDARVLRICLLQEMTSLYQEIMTLLRRVEELPGEIERKKARRRAVPWIDPLDVRYRHYEPQPEPNTKAVMFCLMDVSGSMGKREKDLAKRFFALLHLFLERRYERTEVVFIRHTHEAKEVDEETFFYSQESGGTVVSTALREMQTVVTGRYPPSQWNIYAAQASDGENYADDSEKCVKLLNDALMPLCQYFAYIEILDEREMVLFGSNPGNGSVLWREYLAVKKKWQNFAMKRISRPADIYPVFRELFEPRRKGTRQ